MYNHDRSHNIPFYHIYNILENDNHCGASLRVRSHEKLRMHYEHVQVCEDGTEKRVQCVRHGGASKRHSSWNSNGAFTNTFAQQSP